MEAKHEEKQGMTGERDKEKVNQPEGQKPVQPDHLDNVEYHDQLTRKLGRFDDSLVSDDTLAPDNEKGDEAQEFHSGTTSNEARIQYYGDRRMTRRGVVSVPPEVAAKLNDQARRDREEEEKRAEEKLKLQADIQKKLKAARKGEGAKAEEGQGEPPYPGAVSDEEKAIQLQNAEKAERAATLKLEGHLDLPAELKQVVAPPAEEKKPEEKKDAPKAEAPKKEEGKPEEKKDAPKAEAAKPEAAKADVKDAQEAPKPEAAKQQDHPKEVVKPEAPKPDFQPEKKNEDSPKVQAPEGQREDKKADPKPEAPKPEAAKPEVKPDPAKQVQAPV